MKEEEEKSNKNNYEITLKSKRISMDINSKPIQESPSEISELKNNSFFKKRATITNSDELEKVKEKIRDLEKEKEKNQKTNDDEPEIPHHFVKLKNTKNTEIKNTIKEDLSKESSNNNDNNNNKDNVITPSLCKPSAFNRPKSEICSPMSPEKNNEANKFHDRLSVADKISFLQKKNTNNDENVEETPKSRLSVLERSKLFSGESPAKSSPNSPNKSKFLS